MFANCSNLTRIIFEENGALREIGSQFANTSGIKEIIIPEYISLIKSEAFGNCNKLEKVVLLNPELQVGERIFNSALILNSAGPINWDLGAGKQTKYDIEYAWTTKIPDYAFAAHTNFPQSYIYSIDLPDTLVTIGNGAFKGCANVTKIVIPATVTSIGEEAFYYTGLTSVDVPGSVEYLGPRAFGFTSTLTNAILRFSSCIPAIDNVTDGWFYGCDEALKPKVPKYFIDNPEMYPITEKYGTCWNIYAYNADTNTAFPLDYSGIDT